MYILFQVNALALYLQDTRLLQLEARLPKMGPKMHMHGRGNKAMVAMGAKYICRGENV